MAYRLRIVWVAAHLVGFFRRKVQRRLLVDSFFQVMRLDRFVEHLCWVALQPKRLLVSKTLVLIFHFLEFVAALVESQVASLLRVDASVLVYVEGGMM